MFQTPSERGGIVLRPTDGPASDGPNRFQTPSERGGIVLLALVDGVLRDAGVSNPFRTGRYCAGPSWRCLRHSSYCFKPLQNGAVLCWGWLTFWLFWFAVSNPFRTGRYCAEGRIRDDPGLAHGDGVGCHQ